MPPSRPFRHLLPGERRLWRAYPTRSLVDLRTGSEEHDDPARGHLWGRERTVRAPVIAALLLGALQGAPGHTPGVRLAGARIAGRLDLSDGVLGSALQLHGCALSDTLALADSTTKGIRLWDCRLHRFNADRVAVNGDLVLRGSTVEEGVHLADAQITGLVRISRARIAAPRGSTMAAEEGREHLRPAEGRMEWALWAGGLTVHGGFFADHLRAEGGLRFPGARLRGGLYLQHAAVTALGPYAIQASHLESELMELSRGFTAEGSIRLRGARIAGVLSLDGARLSAPGRVLHLSHSQVKELILTPESVSGDINLNYTHFGVLLDHPRAYPAAVELNGTTYASLRGEAWTPALRRAWIAPARREGYRPQPYEQLAAWYRSTGNEPEARRVLLAKQRMRHRTLNAVGRVWGALLDAAVGYGYRPWLAALWAVLLLAAGTAVFHHHPPAQIALDEERTFAPFVYTLDLLVPVSVFEERGAWEPVGWTRWLAWGMVGAGWVLATALITGATRVLRPGASG